MNAVLVTGGGGFLGSAVVRLLTGGGAAVIAGDIREPAALPDGAVFARCDVTDAEMVQSVIRDHDVDTVVHLAAIVNPGHDEALEYRVDVTGSATVAAACVTAGVRRLVISSSGAAYGYHADNPVPLRESDALRGNEEFSYSRHKRLVEEMLADYRRDHPDLEQVIFRIGTILGPSVDNQITRLWRGGRLLMVAGSDSPFVFIWVDDVAAAIARAATGGPAGIFNVAGEGSMTVPDIAARLGKKTLPIPAWALRAGLTVGHALRLTPHGAGHVPFLQYRPVLDARALRDEFGYTPRYTTREAFEHFVETHPEMVRR